MSTPNVIPFGRTVKRRPPPARGELHGRARILTREQAFEVLRGTAHDLAVAAGLPDARELVAEVLATMDGPERRAWGER